MAKIIRDGVIYGTNNSAEVDYDNTTATVTNPLSASNVQDAIDELADRPAGLTSITSAQYQALADKSGSYVVTDEDYDGTVTWSNPNLLDNPWFTVNQRGQSSYSGMGYTVDRWRTSTNGIVTINTDGSITQATSTGTANVYFENAYLWDRELYGGKTYTASIKYGDDSIESTTFIFPTAVQTTASVLLGTAFNSNGDGLRVYSKADSLGYTLLVQVITNSGSSVTFKAVKLEVGSVSTLKNDVAPNYQQELAKCQRYYQRYYGNNYQFSMGIAGSTGSLSVPFNLVVPMQSKPSISYSAIPIYGTSSMSSGTSATSIVVNNWYANTNIIELLLGGSYTVGTTYKLGFPASSYIEFSADISI